MERRIAAIDVLRGVGVLGMLAVHIQLFASVSLARWNPLAHGDLQGANGWVWLLTHVLADGKFISIFAMLFGASIVMLSDGDARPALARARAHLRRMATLLLLGLAHAYLLWYGDMLVPMALAGVLAVAAARLRPRTVLVLGGVLFAIASLIALALTLSVLRSDPATVTLWRLQWTPWPSAIAAEVARYQGDWLTQMRHRVPTAWETHTWDFAVRLGWQMLGLMLIGMGLFKLGVLSAVRSRRFYVTMAAVGFGLGIPLIALGLQRSFATGWDVVEYVVVSQQLSYWANLSVALGWVAVVMLVCQRGWPVGALAAVGQTALTNYLMQSVVCTTIFYGHGLGLFGQVERTGQLAIVLAIWTAELAGSALWLRHFEMGPAEWLSRWLIRGRRPAFVRAGLVTRP